MKNIIKKISAIAMCGVLTVGYRYNAENLKQSAFCDNNGIH